MTRDTSAPPNNPLLPLRPQEGLGALHLFYKINLAAWRHRPEPDRTAALKKLEDLVNEARQQPQTQVVTCSMFAHADVGFMILTQDLHYLNKLGKADHRFAWDRCSAAAV